jgi:hypothetical protein
LEAIERDCYERVMVFNVAKLGEAKAVGAAVTHKRKRAEHDLLEPPPPPAQRQRLVTRKRKSAEHESLEPPPSLPQRPRLEA